MEAKINVQFYAVLTWRSLSACCSILQLNTQFYCRSQDRCSYARWFNGWNGFDKGLTKGTAAMT